LRKAASSSLSRRQLVSMGLGLLAGTEIASIPLAHAAPQTRTFVLVHGAWHGGWCWRRVADRLTARDHYVVAPTLSGVGERSHLAPGSIDLNTQIDDVVGEIKWKDLGGIVLVGHSYGGMVITGVAEQLRNRISAIVYLDAFLPADGQSLFDITHTTPPATPCDSGAPRRVLSRERNRQRMGGQQTDAASDRLLYRKAEGLGRLSKHRQKGLYSRPALQNACV
jgi:pimeloyl-ACP methyl ester carboxylesterase